MDTKIDKHQTVRPEISTWLIETWKWVIMGQNYSMWLKSSLQKFVSTQGLSADYRT